jgi:hypothetical protein
MQASSWLALFKRMPQDQHDNMSLVTNIGVEVALQQIIRLERDFMVVRGRLTGTMDTGLVIMVPYDQISYMNFVRKMGDEEVNEIFKDFKAPPASAQAAPIASSQQSRSMSEEEFRPIAFSARKAETEQRPAENEVHEETAEPAGKSGAKAMHVSKTMMLARLRARLASDQGKSTPSG